MVVAQQNRVTPSPFDFGLWTWTWTWIVTKIWNTIQITPSLVIFICSTTPQHELNHVVKSEILLPIEIIQVYLTIISINEVIFLVI